MIVNHYAVSFKSKVESDKFFVELFGLEKLREFTAEKNLMKALLGVERDLDIIRYGNDKVDIEVLIVDEPPEKKGKINHICVVVDNMDLILEKAKEMGYETRTHPRKDSGYYFFVKDSSSNLYEIKQ